MFIISHMALKISQHLNDHWVTHSNYMQRNTSLRLQKPNAIGWFGKYTIHIKWKQVKVTLLSDT